MSQQGERPAKGDDWWDKLYDDSVADTAPAASGDSLDERFDSVPHDATRPDGALGPAAPAPPVPQAPPPVREAPAAPAGEPVREPRARAPWEPPEDPEPPRTFADAPPVPLAAPPPPEPPAPPRPQAPPPTLADEEQGVREREFGPPEPQPVDPYEKAGEQPSGIDPRSVKPQPQPQQEPEPEPEQEPEAQQEPETREPVTAEMPPPPAAPPRAPRLPHPRAAFVGDGPPTYDAEPTALPTARPRALEELVADTVLDGARYGTYTLRAASVRGDSARYRGEPRRDALLTARFGAGDAALVLVAVASGARAAEGAHLAARDACHWIGEAVGRSHARLGEDIRAGRRGDLKSGLHRLTDRSYGRLRARAAELGVDPEEYTAGLRCLLLSTDPACRTRVFFGVGGGGLFRLRDGAWQDIEPLVPEPAAVTGEPVVGFGSPPAGDAAGHGPEGDPLTMDLGIATGPGPYVEGPVPPPAEPFRFRASVARPGDTLLLASGGLAEPLRGEPALAGELAGRWADGEPPGLAQFLADTQLRVKGYADDRTAVAVWEA
ncbi:protein phosphatase 2C domain-containing protein [Streptomyces sp. NPDC001941]|uniref:protein phosphatase 2C domain-containing protein n=1 Tax=Streptomyces sp. NPDC001941 TaxID=3154659 RepID=UPI0033342726